MDQRAEIFATLARAKHAQAVNHEQTIRITQLSRHGYLIYHVGLSYLRKLDDTEKKNLELRMSSRNSESYWYWDDSADRAIYARLLIRSGESKKARDLISDLLKSVDLQSYYTSTQTKLQLFMALIELSSGTNTLMPFQIETGALKIRVKPTSNSHRYTYETRRSLLGKTLEFNNIE